MEAKSLKQMGLRQEKASIEVQAEIRKQNLSNFENVDLQRLNTLKIDISKVLKKMTDKYASSQKKFTELRKEINSVKEYTETLKALKARFKSEEQDLQQRINILEATERQNSNFGNRLSKNPSITHSYKTMDQVFKEISENIEEQLKKSKDHVENINILYDEGKREFNDQAQKWKYDMSQFQEELHEEKKQKLNYHEIFNKKQQEIKEKLIQIDILIRNSIEEHKQSGKENNQVKDLRLLKELFTSMKCDKNISAQQDLKNHYIKFMHFSSENEYFESMVLRGTKRWIFQLSLLNNGDFQNWNRTFICLINKNILKKDFPNFYQPQNAQQRYHQNDYFGIASDKHNQLNLDVIESSPFCLDLSDGPINVRINQRKGTLTFQSKYFKYQTDKLLKDQEYRLAIMLGNKDASLKMKLIY